MLLKNILAKLEAIAPLAFAESWDNVGLLAGDAGQDVSRVLLTIDYTAAVAAEGRELGCDLVIAYHPPLFSAVKRITANGPSALIHDAIRRGVAIYSPHTAWDVAPGGSNDLLADILGLIDRTPLRAIGPGEGQLKLVTFVPRSHVEAVCDALFAAGAGQIGKYSSCSFRIAGTGTFLGEAGAKPAVGQAGRLETVEEIRLELIVPRNRVEAVVAVLRKVHPYEEPAFDLAVLAAPPSGMGQGRIGNLPAAVSLGDLVEKVKNELNLSSMLVAGDMDRMIRRAAVCAGAGGELSGDAIAGGADVYLTGEIRHHDALRALNAGMATLCTLHSNSERASLTRLKIRLEEGEESFPEVLVSRADRDPFEIR